MVQRQRPREIKPEGGMNHRWLCVLAAVLPTAALSVATVSVAALSEAALSEARAQGGPRASPGMQQPLLRDDEQIMPSQIVRPPAVTQSLPPKPKAAAKPPRPPATANPEPDDNPVAVAKPAPPAKPPEPARAV